MGKLAVLFGCSATVVVGCSSVSVDCAPLESDGSRCVCPVGTVQVDDWVCELPDGGTLERPGRPDGGQPDVGPYDAGGHEDSGDDGGADPGVDAGSDGGVDAGGVDAGSDGGVDSGPPARPDLRVACATPSVISGAGAEVTIDFEVANLGAATATDFEVAADSLWLEHARVAETRILALAPGESRTGTLRFSAPSTIGQGTNLIDCLVDFANDVEESDESNNSSRVALTASGRVDIVSTGTIPSTVARGTRVTFTVRNNGTVRADGIQWSFVGQYMGESDDFEMDSGFSDTALPVGASMSVVVFGNVPGTGGTGQSVFLAGHVGSGGPDSNLSNNRVVRSSVTFVR